MTEQQTPDREKKIAEIRKSVEEARKTKGSWVDGQDYADDAKFLLDELDRKDEENHKLREQRDAYYKNAQFAEAAAHGIEKLREENRKMIEVLRWYARKDTHELKRRPDGDYIPIVLDHGKRARKILKQIGVNVE